MGRSLLLCWDTYAVTNNVTKLTITVGKIHIAHITCIQPFVRKIVIFTSFVIVKTTDILYDENENKETNFRTSEFASNFE